MSPMRSSRRAEQTPRMYPGPYAAPYQPVSSQVRPSKLWFLLAGGVALAAIVLGFVVIGVAGVNYVDEIDHLHRIEAPGSGQVELSRAGGYSIYYELPAPAFGRDDPPVLRPSVTVTGPDGQNVPIQRYHATVTYDHNDRSGIGVYTFHADKPGSYTIATSSAGLESGAGLAVGHSVGRGLVGAIVAGVLL